MAVSPRRLDVFIPECDWHTIEIDVCRQGRRQVLDVRWQKLTLLIEGGTILTTYFIYSIPEKTIWDSIFPRREVLFQVYLQKLGRCRFPTKDESEILVNSTVKNLFRKKYKFRLTRKVFSAFQNVLHNYCRKVQAIPIANRASFRDLQRCTREFLLIGMFGLICPRGVIQLSTVIHQYRSGCSCNHRRTTLRFCNGHRRSHR